MNRFRRSPAIQITMPPRPRKALPRRLRRNQNLKRTRLLNSSTQLPCGCSQELLDSALIMLTGSQWYLISQLLSELFGGFRKRICRPCFAIARLPSRSPWKRPAIKAATAEESRRIVESAQQEIAAATKAARRELTAHAADLAVTLASKQIKVDATTDQALVRRFAQQLSGDEGAKRN